MPRLTDYPVIVFIVSLAMLWTASWCGAVVLRRRKLLAEDSRQDYGLVLAAILTLLALIVGFTFSMSVERYDLRKHYEEEEANAIGTEYLRAGLLPTANANQVRALLARYLDQRILFYETRDDQRLKAINQTTAELQTDLWAGVQMPGTQQPSATVALAVGGMNDVLNSQGYTQAAWWNRIPSAGWALMTAIAIFSCTMVGYGAKTFKAEAYFLWVLPTVLSISFLLIADIDSPRRGLIRLKPQNLISVAEAIRAPHGGR
jgi:hypothetical protein